MGAMRGYELQGMLIFVVLAVLPAIPALTFGARYVLRRQKGDRRSVRRKLGWSLAVCAIVYPLVTIDAYLIEPNWPRVRSIELPSDLTVPLHILHISDLHLEEAMVPRQRWLVERLERLTPDLILITGDTHQLGNRNVESLRRVLQYVRGAPLGAFACVGFDSVSLLERANPDIVYLRNESVILRHGPATIGLCGFLPGGDRSSLYAAISEADYRIVMNHTPDLADEAIDESVDLCLCGHTHGGQVRIPFWGAIVTNCASGKKYEAGLYRRGTTFVHTSRGLGLEPRPAPQVRFFCRPEITLITVDGVTHD